MKTLTLNTDIHITTVKELKDLTIDNPDYGDLKLNVFPVKHNGNKISLPHAFKHWNNNVNSMFELIPVIDDNEANNHYVTIDSKFFTIEDFLRREGVHIDGNFCADPNFQNKSGPMATWGGTRTTWAGTKVDEELNVFTPLVSPYNIKPPIGQYVSGELGGILCASSYSGCEAWDGIFEGFIGDEGDFSAMNSQLTDNRKIVFEADKVYFMSSNTPHQSTTIPQGVRRTLIRITLNHNYPNKNLLG